MGEHRIALRLAHERLARGIDVLAADLEQAILLAQRAHAGQLRFRVARGHIGDRAEAQLLQVGRQLVEIVVLELLRALVAGHGIAHVAQIGVRGDRAHALGQRQHVAHVGAFVGRVDVEFRNQRGLDPAQQVVHGVRVVLVQQIRLDLRAQRQLHCVLDEVHQLFAGADLFEHLVGQRAGEMALGHGAALLVLGQRQHVPFKIQRDAVAAHQLVDRGDHLAVALIAVRAIGLEERIHLGGLVVRHAVQRHVGHGMLIGIVDALARERRARHVHAALHADRRAHMHDVSRFEELLRAGNGIVIHQAAGTQPRLIGEPDRRRRRIGREGIDRVDVVVHVGALHGLRLLSGQLTQVLQSFGRVEQLERLFAGDRHGEYASILTNIKILYICRLIVRLTRVKISFATIHCSHLLQGVLRLESAVLPPLHPNRRIGKALSSAPDSLSVPQTVKSRRLM